MVPSVSTPSTSKIMILIRRARSVAVRLILQFYGFAPHHGCHPEQRPEGGVEGSAVACSSTQRRYATMDTPCPTRPHPRLAPTTITSRTDSSSSPPPTISNADPAAETPAATAPGITSTSLAISVLIQPTTPMPPEPRPLSPAPQTAEMRSFRPHRRSRSTGTHTAPASVRSAAHPVPSKPRPAPAR
jgi:hypothetical protein